MVADILKCHIDIRGAAVSSQADVNPASCQQSRWSSEHVLIESRSLMTLFNGLND